MHVSLAAALAVPTVFAKASPARGGHGAGRRSPAARLPAAAGRRRARRALAMRSRPGLRRARRRAGRAEGCEQTCACVRACLRAAAKLGGRGGRGGAGSAGNSRRGWAGGGGAMKKRGIGARVRALERAMRGRQQLSAAGSKQKRPPRGQNGPGLGLERRGLGRGCAGRAPSGPARAAGATDANWRASGRQGRLAQEGAAANAQLRGTVAGPGARRAAVLWARAARGGGRSSSSSSKQGGKRPGAARGAERLCGEARRRRERAGAGPCAEQGGAAGGLGQGRQSGGGKQRGPVPCTKL